MKTYIIIFLIVANPELSRLPILMNYRTKFSFFSSFYSDIMILVRSEKNRMRRQQKIERRTSFAENCLAASYLVLHIVYSRSKLYITRLAVVNVNRRG